MRTSVVARLDSLARDHSELALGLPEAAFSKDLGARSNTIGSQFWCVIGARESYGAAIESGVWRGFSCSLRLRLLSTYPRERLSSRSEFGFRSVSLSWWDMG